MTDSSSSSSGNDEDRPERRKRKYRRRTTTTRRRDDDDVDQNEIEDSDSSSNDVERTPRKRKYRRRTTTQSRYKNRDDDVANQNELEDSDTNSDDDERTPRKRKYRRRTTTRETYSKRDNEKDSDSDLTGERQSSNEDDGSEERESRRRRSRSNQTSNRSSSKQTGSLSKKSSSQQSRSSTSESYSMSGGGSSSGNSSSNSGNESSSSSSQSSSSGRSSNSQQTRTSRRSKSSNGASNSSGEGGSRSPNRSRSTNRNRSSIRSRMTSRVLNGRKKTKEARRVERSQRTKAGSAWHGEWLQIKRMLWRLNRYFENRYFNDDENVSEYNLGSDNDSNSSELQNEESQVRLYQDGQTAKTYRSRSNNKSQRRRHKAVALSSGGHSKKDSGDTIWKVTATTGSLGLALLLLLNLMPTHANQGNIPLSADDVIDTRTVLLETESEEKPKPIHYEIVLGNLPDTPLIASLPPKPKPEIIEEPVEIIPDEPEEELVIEEPEPEPEPVVVVKESDFQLDFERLPLTGELAKYLEHPEETELFLVKSKLVIEPVGIAKSDYDDLGEIPAYDPVGDNTGVENTSAAIIEDDNWDQFTAVANTNYSDDLSYEGQSIPESIVSSIDHVPSEYKNGYSTSEPDRAINIEIEKIYPALQAVGDTQEYVIQLKNLSDQTIDEINVSELIPSGMQVIKVEPAASYEDRKLSWKFLNIEAGSVQQIQIKVKVKKAGMIQSVAYVQPVVSVASESLVETFTPKFRLAMITPEETPVGESYPVRYQVTNLSDEDVNEIVLETDLPVEIDHRYGRKLKYEIGTLKAGASREIILQAVADNPGVGVQTASLISQFGNSSTVRKNVRVVQATRGQQSPPQRIQQASPGNDCCCWKLSLRAE